MIQAQILLSEAATEAASYERLFGLDIQLIHDTLWTALAVALLFFVASYLLFNPVRDMLKKRQEKIENEINDAAQMQEDAKAMKQEYEAKLTEAQTEAEEILDNARKKALKNETSIIDEAKEEAVRIRKRAMSDVELEKERALDDMKKEMVSIAAAMAGKVVSQNMNTEIQDSLVEETLKGIGEDTWQKQ